MFKKNPQVFRLVKGRAGGQREKGFTLIEILVTLFILAIGLLGLASLLFEGMLNNQGAYLRTQASILAYDMADRMRANKDQATAYDNFTTDGASTALPACASQAAGCSAAGLVDYDKAAWTRQIQNVGSNMTMIPGGIGTISHDAATNTYTISVQWQEGSRSNAAGQIAGDNSYTVSFTL
ncbi:MULTISPECIES: type IV pilus modification protein PilV [Marinobacter]|uniref:Type IV pilus modification protein PilV n=1 Tax=Marinobacter suaedae TaxID=3057675 RepID=A0ABT8W4W1_9GAMM|nr:MULTISPECIES: type IV pilus modification protein PilV [unclassified Marinobacter]MBZ2170105.1 type IV pilus modification protein PilV [Marinobacter sp. F4216]MDO3723280.1 type IV pilus modification protein PilV [Marinobacter sp. chi1]